MSYIYYVICLITGSGIGYFISKNKGNKKLKEAEEKAKQIIKDAENSAENLKKEKLLEAKEKFVHLKSEHDAIILDKNKKISEVELKIKQRENALSQKESHYAKTITDNEALKEALQK